MTHRSGGAGSGAPIIHDSKADEAVAFCIAQGLIKPSDGQRLYTTNEIYRLKLIKVLIGNMQVAEELRKIQSSLSENVGALGPKADHLDRAGTFDLVRELLEDFPDKA